MALATDTQEEPVLEDTDIRAVRAMEAMASREALGDMVTRVSPVMDLMVTRGHRALADMDTSRHRGPEGMGRRAGNMFEKGAKWLAVLHLCFRNHGNAFRNPCFNMIKSDLANSQQRT